MNKAIAILSFALVSAPAFASVQRVPEMSAGAGVAAIALLVGAAAILRERNKK